LATRSKNANPIYAQGKYVWKSYNKRLQDKFGAEIGYWARSGG